MQITKMLLAAQAAADAQEVPTTEQVMTVSTALHKMTVRMPEFLWYSNTFENMREVAFKAGESAVSNELEDLPGFIGTHGQLDALSVRLAA
jgi:hypothetical protein